MQAAAAVADAQAHQDTHTNTMQALSCDTKLIYGRLAQEVGV